MQSTSENIYLIQSHPWRNSKFIVNVIELFYYFFYLLFLFITFYLFFLKTCFFRIIDTACNAWHDVTITCCKYQKCYFHSERYLFHSMDIYRISHVFGFDIISNDLFVFYPQALARALKALNKLGYEQFIQWVMSTRYGAKYVIKLLTTSKSQLLYIVH